MKRAMFWVAAAACTFSLAANARSGGAETQTPPLPAPRAIALEVLIVATHGGNEHEQAVPLCGPSEEVASQVRDLESQGRIVDVDRIRLTTLEDQTTVVQAGKNTPVASGRSFGGRGGPPVQNSYQYQNLGTMISATARVDGDAVVVELEVEKSQLEGPAGKPQADDEFVPLGTETLTSRATLRIGNGQTVLAGGLESRSEGKSSGQLVLLSARLLDGPSEASSAGAADHAQARQIRIPRAPKDEEKPDTTPVDIKYEKMEKKDLREELKRLQKEVLDAERVFQQARAKAAQAEKTYRTASDEEKTDALLGKIEADAAGRKPMERFAQIRSEFAAAERAYLNLLVAE
jgi:hypothetical protein